MRLRPNPSLLAVASVSFAWTVPLTAWTAENSSVSPVGPGQRTEEAVPEPIPDHTGRFADPEVFPKPLVSVEHPAF